MSEITTKITYTCPQCKNQTYIQDIDKSETYCEKCGLIIQTAYPFTAGHKHKTLSDFQIEKINKKQNERMEKRWKKTIS